METTAFNSRLKKALCFAAALVLVFTLFAQTTFAASDDWDGTYYLSYKKYVEAEQPEQVTYTMVAKQISNLLSEGMRRMEEGVEKDGDDGYYKPFTNSYGFWYETSGFEKTVMGYISGARVNEVELGFSNMKKAAQKGDIEATQEEVDKLEAMLFEDAAKLDDIFGYENESEGGGSGVAWATFVAVLTIIVREGLEAILIVGAMVAYLEKTGNKKGTKHVYIGAVVALAVVMVVFFLIKVYGVKLPLKPFFYATSILMAIMSIAFLGAGMWELFLDGGLAEKIGGVAQSLSGTIPALSWMNGSDVTLTGSWFDHHLEFEKEEGSYAMVGRNIADSEGIHAGDTIKVKCGKNEAELSVVGVYESGDDEDDCIFTTLDVAQELSGSGKVFQKMEVSAITSPEDELAVRAAKNPNLLSGDDYDTWYCTAYVSSICFQIQEAIPEASAAAVRQIADSEGKILDKTQLLMTLITLMSLLGAIGGILGSLLGYAFAQYISMNVFGSAITFRPLLIPITIVASVLVTGLACISPIKSAVEVDPALVLKGE